MFDRAGVLGPLCRERFPTSRASMLSEAIPGLAKQNPTNERKSKIITTLPLSCS